jgi:large subunit ribosomal protein L20
MTRVKRGYVAKKRRKKILNLTKGFRGSHSKLFKTANQQIMKSLSYSYADRRKKKADFKSLWIKRINLAARLEGIPYHKFINEAKKNKIILNKKVLSEIILKDIKTFNNLIKLI